MPEDRKYFHSSCKCPLFHWLACKTAIRKKSYETYNVTKCERVNIYSNTQSCMDSKYDLFSYAASYWSYNASYPALSYHFCRSTHRPKVFCGLITQYENFRYICCVMKCWKTVSLIYCPSKMPLCLVMKSMNQNSIVCSSDGSFKVTEQVVLNSPHTLQILIYQISCWTLYIRVCKRN